jgi:hypothetical protein
MLDSFEFFVNAIFFIMMLLILLAFDHGDEALEVSDHISMEHLLCGIACGFRLDIALLLAAIREVYLGSLATLPSSYSLCTINESKSLQTYICYNI